MHIVGTNGNRTDLYVKIHELKEPSKETAFENCVADVNIPEMCIRDRYQRTIKPL